MIGYFSEVVAVLGSVKLLTAAAPYFYGSPIGYLALIVLVGLAIGIWILLLKITQEQDEYGGSAKSNPVMKTVAPAIAILAVGAPVAIQWQTFATPAQTAHIQCSVFSPLSQKTCFANWVKKEQARRAAS